MLAHAPCGRWTRRMWPTCAVGRRSALRREAGMRRDAGDPGDVVRMRQARPNRTRPMGRHLWGPLSGQGAPCAACREGHTSASRVRRGPGRRGRLRAADLNRTAEPGGGGGDNSGLIHSRPWRALNVLCEAGRGEQGVRAEPSRAGPSCSCRSRGLRSRAAPRILPDAPQRTQHAASQRQETTCFSDLGRWTD